MKVKVSDYIFEFLKQKGIDTIFSVSGGAAAHLLNSIKNSSFNYVCNYNEQASAMAAEGYALMSNKPACVLVTNGPGSSNTITGVLGAYQDSVPMIVISGQVPINQSMGSTVDVKLRQLGVQECDIISMVKPITKYAVQITNADMVHYHLTEAYQQATTGRKGPVWLDIPLDIQSSMIEVVKHTPNEDTVQQHKYDPSEIIRIVKESKNPIIITGNGIHLSQTEDKFSRLKEILQIPVVSTWTSKDLMGFDDNLFVGTFGLMGDRPGNFAVQSADLLLVLGSRLSIPNIGYQTHLFSPKSFKIMVDIDDNELYKPTINIDYPLNMDLSVFFDSFIDGLENVELPNWNDWVQKTHNWKIKYPVFLPEYKLNTNKINSFYFMEVLSNKLTDNNVVVTDMGTSYTCTMQSLRMNGKNRLFTSSACCSMGFGLPGAIGAYFSDKSKDVVLIAGDGGLQMNIQELQTIIHNKIPIKIFVLNNNGYLAISLMQDNLFMGNYMGSTNESGVSSPSFTKLAMAYGFKTYKFENNEQLELQIDDVLSETCPVLCEVLMVDNQQLIPRVQSTKDSEGKIVSNSLENMFPYLSDDEMKKIK